MKIVLIVYIGIFILTIFFIIHQKDRSNKLLELTKQRSKFTKTDFMRHFLMKGFREDQISFIYDEIFKFIELKDFSLMPNDNLYEVCGFHDLDDVEFIDSIFTKMDINIPSQDTFDKLNEKYMNFTPEYLIDLISNTNTTNGYEPSIAR